MLRDRVLTGLVGVPALLGLVFLVDGVGHALTVALFAVAGTWELLRLLHVAGYRPFVPVGVGLAAVFVLDAARPDDRILPAALAMASVVTAAWLMLRAERPDAITDWALTFAPAVYVGGLLHFFVPLRALEGGVGWVTGVLVCTWFSDSIAYFVGRAFGRTRLAPKISPGKSVEGALAGVVAAVIAGVAVGIVFGLPPLRLAGFGLTIGVCAVLGDLIESFIKRQCGAKDSGAIIPGHGGLLDRMDSLMLAVAGAYFYVAVTA